jgi:hypothetical protein
MDQNPFQLIGKKQLKIKIFLNVFIYSTDEAYVKSESYAKFDLLDGQHSLKAALSAGNTADANRQGYVDYPARTRSGGTVFYFNFELAREMGLIGSDHPAVLTDTLRKKILDTFSIVIINEYDQIHKTPIDPKTIKPNSFMATRYLQLQHPNKQGKTSGDGRGIWNGEIKNQGITWDVSSSGTGATCLSPAHAQTKKFFKTGDRVVGYGNGYNCINEGLSAALMSEIFHKQGIETERTLAIITFEGGSSINVRASKNLLRPAHFFRQLKLGHLEELRATVQYFIERQVQNGTWPSSFKHLSRNKQYEQFAIEMAKTFSKISARFEADYIFCWMEWDGDNILANGGIIDYGSIRQFGLYHHEYRYDDVDRMSTTIPEQKLKARHMIQNFAQIRDYLITGKKRSLRAYKNDSILKQFDQNFKHELHVLLLKKIGLSERHIAYLQEHQASTVGAFKKVHSYFEKTKSSRGIYAIDDGITCDAIFCMADLHRELPQKLLKSMNSICNSDFIATLKSSYAKKKDLKISPYRSRKILQFQKLYLKIVTVIAHQFYRGNVQMALLEMVLRATLTNQQNRITGDGVLEITASLIRNQKRLSFHENRTIIDHLVFIQTQPPGVAVHAVANLKADLTSSKIVSRSIKAIKDNREGC